MVLQNRSFLAEGRVELSSTAFPEYEVKICRSNSTKESSIYSEKSSASEALRGPPGPHKRLFVQDCLPREATKEEIQELPHEVGNIPIAAWLVAFTGAASRLAWFGCTCVWQNYIQNPRGNPDLPGGLGLGQATASTMQNAFLLHQYITPLPFAVISDVKLGRYKTMIFNLGLLMIGYTILCVTSLPVSLKQGAGIAGLVATMTLIGLGQGGVSAVIYPLLGDQVPDTAFIVERNKQGNFIVMVNIAAMSLIITTSIEKQVDFWLAYLLPTSLLVVASIPIIVWNKRIGNVLLQSLKVLSATCNSHFRISAAYPEYQRAQYNRNVPWTTSFVDEIRQGLHACRVITCFILFYLSYSQCCTNFISQTGQMEVRGLSNDTIQALNPISCSILGIIFQHLLFPALRRRRIHFGPIARMTVALYFIAAGIAYAAGVQHHIYSQGPCFEHPRDCSAAGPNRRPNEVSVWLQTPLHVLFAEAEILGLVSLSEYAYALAPRDIKAVVQAVQQLTAAAGSGFGTALGPVSKDPWLVVMYAVLTGLQGLNAAVFWVVFRKCDNAYESVEGWEVGGVTQSNDTERVSSANACKSVIEN